MSKSADYLAEDMLDEISTLQQEFKDPEYDDIYPEERIDDKENELYNLNIIKFSKKQLKESEVCGSILLESYDINTQQYREEWLLKKVKSTFSIASERKVLLLSIGLENILKTDHNNADLINRKTEENTIKRTFKLTDNNNILKNSDYNELNKDSNVEQRSIILNEADSMLKKEIVEIKVMHSVKTFHNKDIIDIQLFRYLNTKDQVSKVVDQPVVEPISKIIFLPTLPKPPDKIR